MQNSWLSILPPLIVLLAAFITKRLNLALLAGLASAALIATHGSILAACSLLINRIITQISDTENIFLYCFLIIIGIIITLFEYNGAALAFAQRLTHRLKTAKATQLSCLLLSASLFIDDYLSCLTSGYVMRPLMDRFAIARAKFAYLIHSFSAPVVILAPISSWLALITSQLENAGVNPGTSQSIRVIADPFYLYLQAIPFIFYSLILVVSVFFIVLFGISYGPMATQEEIARETGNLFGGKKPYTVAATATRTDASWLDLALPLLILIFCFIAGILWAGGWTLLGGSATFIQALQRNNQTGFILFIASITTLAIALAMSFARSTIRTTQLPALAWSGFAMMRSSIIMVFLASTLGLMLREDLHTGSYLAQALLGNLWLPLLPLIFYVIAIIIAVITGSAWGTIALLVPIAVQMITTFAMLPLPLMVDQLPLLIPVLGAIFSGSVCGNHVSPIAETTIMSANSAGCYPLDHAYTQFWYALPAIISAGVAFMVCGLFAGHSLVINFAASLASGLTICIALILLGQLFFGPKKR